MEKKSIEQNEISEMCTFSLGGYDQKVLMEGKRRDLPIVIFLHGGPGTPIPFNAGCRGLFPAFTDRFLMVYWDQLGCGINNRLLPENTCIQNFVSMTEDLIRQVRQRFPGNPLFLFATSWGTVLSARVLKTCQIDGVLACGQVTHDLGLNASVLKALEASEIPGKKLDRIRRMDLNSVSPKDLQLLFGSLRKYTDAYQNRQGKKPPIGPILLGMLKSPDYRLRDFAAIQVNGYTRNPRLFHTLFLEVMKTDLRPVLKAAQVPYCILQGDTDTVTPTDFVQELVSSAENPNLTCEVIENAGHYPNPDTMDRVLARLSEMAAQPVRPAADAHGVRR